MREKNKKVIDLLSIDEMQTVSYEENAKIIFCVNFETQ